jgi:hypothetical protein
MQCLLLLPCFGFRVPLVTLAPFVPPPTRPVRARVVLLVIHYYSIFEKKNALLFHVTNTPIINL